MASCHETRHGGGDTLATHRHRAAYAALVVDGDYTEASLDGPVACTPGTLVLHPAFHAHGDRFGRGGARVLNLALPAHAVPRFRVLHVADLRQARRVFERHPQELDALLGEAASPADGLALPDWQAAFVDALLAGEDDIGRIARRLGVSAAHASRALGASRHVAARAAPRGPLAARARPAARRRRAGRDRGAGGIRRPEPFLAHLPHAHGHHAHGAAAADQRRTRPGGTGAGPIGATTRAQRADDARGTP